MPDRNKLGLLSDVLAEETSPGFRDALLADTLGLVRRRRRIHRAFRAGAALAIVAALGLIVFRSPTEIARAPLKRSRPYQVVVSKPLLAAALVRTQPMAPGCIVASSETAAIVRTASARKTLHEITDSELLALLGSRPAALVRRAPHMAELVFVRETDQEELLRN